MMVERCPVIFHHIEDALDELQDYFVSVKEDVWRRTHIHFNTLSSGKKSLETGTVCNSEEHFRNPNSMASTKFNEKSSQCNKAEILTTKISKCTEPAKESKLLNPPKKMSWEEIIIGYS